MSFMVLEVVQMHMWHVETTAGTEYVPADLIGVTVSPDAFDEYVEGEVLTQGEAFDAEGDGNGAFLVILPQAECVVGWYARESAPGYMDCTDWVGPYDDEETARQEYCDMHDICPRCLSQCFYGETPCPEEGDDEE